MPFTLTIQQPNGEFCDEVAACLCEELRTQSPAKQRGLVFVLDETCAEGHYAYLLRSVGGCIT